MAIVKETWRPVVEYEGLYEVSNLGQIRSLDRLVKGKKEGFRQKVNGKLLTPIKNRQGYLRVNLCNDDGRKAKFVHRLVCSAFLPNPYNFPYINHKDENPLNNNVENLEWCTAKYNCNYGNHRKNVSLSKIGKRPNLSREALERINAPKRKPVIGTHIETGEEIFFKSMASCKDSGFSPQNVSHCVTKRQHTHKGYTWRYANICQPQTI